MSIDNDEMPMRTIQELRTADAPKLYRPHAPAKSKVYDPEAPPHPNCTLCGTCSRCGVETGKPNAHYQLCATCEPPIRQQAAAREAEALLRQPEEPKATRPAARGTGTSRRGKLGPRRPLDLEAIIEAYTGGQTITGIAAALGTKHARLRDVLLEAGIELRDDTGRGGRPRSANPRPTPTPRRQLDAQAIITAYLAGATPPTLASEHGCTPKRIRDLLDAHRIERRDDRATSSGGKRIARDPEFVEAVRRLYLDEQLSQSQVAGRLGTTTKVVHTVMARHQIPGRKGETGRMDGAAPLKVKIAQLGVPVLDIKTWGLQQGLLLQIAPGIPPARVVDAYIAAHPTDRRQDGAA